jgi:hypothetical protein
VISSNSCSFRLFEEALLESKKLSKKISWSFEIPENSRKYS